MTTVCKILPDDLSLYRRPPFSKGEDDFQVVRREVLQHALDITHAVQRSTDVHSAVTTIKTSVSLVTIILMHRDQNKADPRVNCLVRAYKMLRLRAHQMALENVGSFQ